MEKFKIDYLCAGDARRITEKNKNGVSQLLRIAYGNIRHAANNGKNFLSHPFGSEEINHSKEIILEASQLLINAGYQVNYHEGSMEPNDCPYYKIIW